ncbi:hypothetical protein QQ020_12815 [Fulvivirgaceae bacterium BMA12]|uniref:Uncharacterized protein n=1 Tax=Agaribacillus aureus TaxID=3051825 RepID=A0ABT8L5E8_9BACT|nr:hypothetical protein [Fulvivirgaceae bacterium BMA12]
MSEKAPTNTDEVIDLHASEKNPKKKKNFKAVLGKIGLDMIPVVFGILIALFINNLRENYQDRKLLEATLSSLSKEFQKNIEGIESNRQRLTQLSDTLRHYREEEMYSIFDLAAKADGVGLAEIYSINWQISLNNNSLRLLNVQTIHLLSKIDEKHKELNEQASIIYPIVYGPPFFQKGKEGLAYRKGFEIWLTAYIGNEKELLTLYEDFEKAVADQ